VTTPATGASAVDHLVVAAATLAQGVAWCEATLGVTPGPGGRHTLMGTHNRLFRIDGDAFPEAYFEIIAIDPDAPPPGRPRWFGLDEPALQARIAQRPQLVHVVARCTALQARRQALVDAGCMPGELLAAGRDTPQGWLQWQITVRDDGRLEHGGALPTLIEWQGVHPTAAMPASGVTLRALALRGLPEAGWAALRLHGVEHHGPAGVGPALSARLQTPLGKVALHTA
jgi:Glyoxalase-like domain